MSFKFYNQLSKKYINMFKSGEFSDIEIEVGNESEGKKIFELHSLILKIHSPYFNKILSLSNDNNNIIKIENISVKIFEILIKYIYGGTINITHNNVKTNVELLIAADKLQLGLLKSVILLRLLKDKKLLKQNLVLIQHVATNFTQFTKLSSFYKTTIRQDPSLIFKANDFITIKENALLDFVKKNNNSLKPIEIWDKLMEWTIAQNSSSNTMIMKPFIPHINFKEIDPKDFSEKIKPYKDIFDIEFYIQILEYYSTNEDAHLKFKINLVNIDSEIINSDHAFLLCNFIKITKNENSNNFYDFKLLMRGSRDGFDRKTFYDRCYKKEPTITVAHIKNTDEIVGGFNPLTWGLTGDYQCCDKSFIFSLDKNNLKKYVFSKVVDNEHAIHGVGINFGCNGSDLRLLSDMNNRGQCFKNSYEKLIRKNEGSFEIDDYEVFQVISKSN